MLLINILKENRELASMMLQHPFFPHSLRFPHRRQIVNYPPSLTVKSLFSHRIHVLCECVNTLQQTESPTGRCNAHKMTFRIVAQQAKSTAYGRRPFSAVSTFHAKPLILVVMNSVMHRLQLSIWRCVSYRRHNRGPNPSLSKRDGFGPGQLHQKDAQRQKERCSLYSTEFMTTKIVDLA